MPNSHRVLPNFSENFANTKNSEIDQPAAPQEIVQLYLNRLAERRSGAVPLRILDVGCGRGDTVGWLCARGFDAHGVDPSADYIDRGRRYLARVGLDPMRLQLLSNEQTYPFADDTFDVVLSDQVIEHVEDVELFIAEISRVSAPGAHGLHIYPCRWQPVEVHLLTPFAHWLPKGRLRRMGLAACIRLGLAAPYFEEFSLRHRIEIFAQYSENETFYPPLRRVLELLDRHGMEYDAKLPSQERVRTRMPRVPHAALPFLAYVYRHVLSTIIYTKMR